MECEIFNRSLSILSRLPVLTKMNNCRLSMMQSQSSTHWTKIHTRIQHSSCSFWETTSRYGHLTHRVMETSHQLAMRTNQTKFQWYSKLKIQELSTKKKKKQICAENEIVITKLLYILNRRKFSVSRIDSSVRCAVFAGFSYFPSFCSVKIIS